MTLGATLSFLQGQLTGTAPPGLDALSVDVLPKPGRASGGPQCILWCRAPKTERLGMGGPAGVWTGTYPIEVFLRLGVVPGQQHEDWLFPALLAFVDKTLRELPDLVPWPPLIADPISGDQSILVKVADVVSTKAENVRLARRMFELRALVTVTAQDFWQGY